MTRKNLLSRRTLLRRGSYLQYAASTLAAAAILAAGAARVMAQTVPASVSPQTTIAFNTPGIAVGTESVNLSSVANGNFEGGLVGGNAAYPVHWSAGRFGDTFATAPIDGIANDGTTVARSHIDGNNPINAAEGYSNDTTVTLAANTKYVFSAYIWNFSQPSSGRSVTAAVDALATGSAGASYVRMNIFASQASTTTGYLVWQEFTTGSAPVTLTPRVFYDGGTGVNTGWPEQPVATQWDNVAFTLKSAFVPPTGYVPAPSAIYLFGSGLLCGVRVLHVRQRRPKARSCAASTRS